MSPEKKSSIPCGYVQQCCTTPRKYTTLAILKRGKGWKLTLHKTNLSPHKIGWANPTPNPSFFVNSLLNIDPCKSRRPVKNHQKKWNWLWIPTKVESFPKKNHRSITPPKFNTSLLGRFHDCRKLVTSSLESTATAATCKTGENSVFTETIHMWTWFNSMCD